MPKLVLGPLLRYVGETQATIWVETDAPAEVEVLVEGLAPDRTYGYRVGLDGEPVWPEPEPGPGGGPAFPPSADRRRGKGADALYTFPLRMRQADPATWPDLLLLLGDQIYADDTSEQVQAFIRSRRDVGRPPGLEVADFEEYTRLEAQAGGDFDHLLLATSLPFALAPAVHDLEAWNEAVTGGAWGRLPARVGEKIRQGIDLEHWAAFGDSFDRLAGLIEAVAAGRRGRAPGSVLVLSGDVHHTYLAELSFRGRHAGEGHSPAWQVVCSPLRNPLARDQRAAHRRAFRRPARAVTRWLARRAGVAPPAIAWRVVEGPRFDNHLGVLELDGRAASLRVERAVTPTDGQGPPYLEPLYARRLADGG